ncbi:MAG: YIP1 family protein [Candidatus Heimdallarchaeota archaeon]
MNSDTTSPKYCGSCGKELLPGAAFCAHCGAPVPKLGPQSLSQIPASPYYITSRPAMSHTEPPLPFLQYFQGVIITPQKEMPKIVERPNYKHPFFLSLLIGILAGVSMAVFLSKLRMTIFPEFYQNIAGVDLPASFYDEFDFESYLRFTFIILSVLGPIISWLVDSVILYLLMAVVAPAVSSHRRNFKTAATITGWASVPQFVGQIVDIGYNWFFVSEMTVVLRTSEDIQKIAIPAVSGFAELILLGIGIGVLIWGGLMVYWGVKSMVPEGNQPVIISVIYSGAVLVLNLFLI